MKRKTVLLGLSLMVMANILVLYFVSYLHMRSFVAMSLWGGTAWIVWRFYLKEKIPIHTQTSDSRIVLITSPLFAIPIIALVYFIAIYKEPPQYSLLILMFLSSLATGVYEEFIFRGITFGTLLQSGLSLKDSIYLSAAIFALFHIFDIGSMTTSLIFLKLLNAFVMGVVLAFVYYATRNIIYVMFIHTVWDMQLFIQGEYAANDAALIVAGLLFFVSLFYCIWSCKNATNKIK